MKKTLLKIGSIIVSTIPVVTLVACNDNQDKPNNSGDSDNNVKTINEYVPKHNKNEYPKDNKQSYYESLESYALDLVRNNVKNENYFKKNPSLRDGADLLDFSKNGKYIAYFWTESATGNKERTDYVFNFYELYDYAHDQDLKIHYPDYDSSDNEYKKIAEKNNSFPYLKNN